MKSIMDKVGQIFLGSFDQTALLEGVSDIVVVKWDSGYYASTPFLACFGHISAVNVSSPVRIYINQMLINKIQFSVDKYGYAHPMHPSQEILKKLPLSYGRNTIKFQIQHTHHAVEAEIYFYSQHDKLLVSDVDGTMTKNDLGGLFNNFKNANYLHDGYYELINKISNNGYKIVWLTMRSLPLYQFSKNYIRQHASVHGVLLTQPEEFLPAVTKQIMKKTGNIKTNMMRSLQQLFPQGSTPFIGGLGNRQNDAIAYLAAGISKQKIFIIDTNSQVHNLANNHGVYTYRSINEQIHLHFPYFQTQAIQLNLNGQIQKVKRRFKKRLKTKVQLFEDDGDEKDGLLSTITTNQGQSQLECTTQEPQSGKNKPVEGVKEKVKKSKGRFFQVSSNINSY